MLLHLHRKRGRFRPGRIGRRREGKRGGGLKRCEGVSEGETAGSIRGWLGAGGKESAKTIARNM